MTKISLKIAYPIIITGLFIMVVFVSVTYDILSPNFYLVLIPLTAFLFLFGFAIGQRFASPVKEILKEADYLSKGNFKTRVSIDNNDELGQLAQIFNRIAEEFERSKSTIGSLDMKVKLRTKTLEEIIVVLEKKIKNRNAEFQRVVEDLERTKSQVAVRDQEIADLKKQTNKKRK